MQLLLRAGYDYVPYSSLKRVIEENQPRYYGALRSSQLAMRDNLAALGDWLLFPPRPTGRQAVARGQALG